MPFPHRAVAGLALMLLLAACGSGATGDLPAGPEGAAPALPAARAVVAADFDGDGINDLATIPLEGDEDPECWRGKKHGDYERAEDWREHPAVDAMRTDLAGRGDHEILADHGVHDAGAGEVFAVLHLDRPEREPPGDATIEELTPEEGPPGALVAIKGHDLAVRDEKTRVTFDGIAARVLVAFPGFVLAFAPEALPLGRVDVAVTRGESASNAAPFEVVDRPIPVITDVRPDPVSPGVLAVIEGMHLGTLLDDVRVSFGGAEAKKVLALGRLLFARVPDNATTGPLTVTVNGAASAPFDIGVVKDQPGPTLDTVTPAEASVGSLVEIEGEQLFVLGRTIRVYFGTARAAIFGRGKDSIVAVVPPGADGDVSVRVGEQTSAGLPFRVLERGLPQIDRITPNRGAPLDRVDIAGADLYDLSFLKPDGPPSLRPLLEFSVTFGGARAFLVFPTVEGLRAVVPLRAETGDVVVTVNGRVSNGVLFTVN